MPRDSAERQAVLGAVRAYSEATLLVPPMTLAELRIHAEKVVDTNALPDRYLDFVMIAVGNELWRDRVADVPYERRILLLPQCLRNPDTCPAGTDAVGLLCEECGRCSIGVLQSEAEALGYNVLVAEGTTVVTTLLRQGKADAVIGVSCMDVCEQAHPYMTDDAVPGLAIPLLYDGCSCTQVDMEWVRQTLSLSSGRTPVPIPDPDAVRSRVACLFQDPVLSRLSGAEQYASEQAALRWLGGQGKRWRPVLAVSAFEALSGRESDLTHSPLANLAVAVECFHKASLIHDDIEDADEWRYGVPALHVREGMPVALNAGDLLLGIGYRLIAQCGLQASLTSRLAGVAADAHYRLCLGQGEELIARRDEIALAPETVLNIFRLKTAPAFEVALRFGALAAGCSAELDRALTGFSEALGVAYQIRDDVRDVTDTSAASSAAEPSIVGALLRRGRSDSGERWTEMSAGGKDYDVNQAVEDAMCLCGEWKQRALDALRSVGNYELKMLLYRLASRILES